MPAPCMGYPSAWFSKMVLENSTFDALADFLEGQVEDQALAGRIDTSPY
jgi:hypothetical protein